MARAQRLMGVAASVALAFGLMGALGCSPNAGTDLSADDIAVYTRESGSGTRATFVELFDIEQTDASGQAVDLIADTAAITNSTAVMMTTVGDDKDAIGYISLGTLDAERVKALAIDGVSPTLEDVENGSYAIVRPFNLVTDGEVSDLARDFIAYVMSEDGQAIVADNEYLRAVETADVYQASGTSGKLVVAGSSSVYPVMEKLAEAYEELNPDASIAVQLNDSSTGATMVSTDTCDIAMVSRQLDASEVEKGLVATCMAWDGIVVIVNNESTLDGLTAEQVRDIFIGETTTWKEVMDA